MSTMKKCLDVRDASVFGLYKTGYHLYTVWSGGGERIERKLGGDVLRFSTIEQAADYAQYGENLPVTRNGKEIRTRK